MQKGRIQKQKRETVLGQILFGVEVLMWILMILMFSIAAVMLGWWGNVVVEAWFYWHRSSSDLSSSPFSPIIITKNVLSCLN